MPTYFTPLLNLETTDTNLVEVGGMTAEWEALDNINGTLTVTIPAGSSCGGPSPGPTFPYIQFDLLAIGRGVAHVEVTGGGCSRVSSPSCTIARVRNAAYLAFGHIAGDFVSGSPVCAAGDLELVSGDNPADVPLRCGDTLRLGVINNPYDCPAMEVVFTVRIDPPTCE